MLARASASLNSVSAILVEVGERKTGVPKLRAPDMTLRARTYRIRAFNLFTEARKILLP
jgi:hypothetical protein